MPELRLWGSRFWFRKGTDPVDPARPSVTFVHGAGASSLTWIYQIRGLGKLFNCVAPDLPGHGKTDDDSECDTVSSYAKAVIKTLDALSVERSIIVGHSLGGAIALQCLLDHPDRFDGACLFGVGPVIPVSHLISEALKGAGDVWLRFMQDLLFSPTTPRRFARKTTLGGMQAPQPVVVRDYRACEGWDARNRLSGLRTPCLLVAGRHDALTPLPLVESLQTEIAGARLAVIDDAGHMAMLEQHKDVNERLVEFIEGIYSD